MNAALLILTVFVNFVSYEKMQEICWPIHDGARACYVSGEIYLPAMGQPKARHQVTVTFNWLSWERLADVCGKPACTDGHMIQAVRDWYPDGEAFIGFHVFRQQGWDTTAYNQHELLGHELLHAAGLTHP